MKTKESEKAKSIENFSKQRKTHAVSRGFCKSLCKKVFNLERPTGVEPASSAWKAEVIPLYERRVDYVDVYKGIPKVRQVPLLTFMALHCYK